MKQSGRFECGVWEHEHRVGVLSSQVQELGRGRLRKHHIHALSCLCSCQTSVRSFCTSVQRQSGNFDESGFRRRIKWIASANIAPVDCGASARWQQGQLGCSVGGPARASCCGRIGLDGSAASGGRMPFRARTSACCQDCEVPDWRPPDLWAVGVEPIRDVGSDRRIDGVSPSAERIALFKS